MAGAFLCVLCVTTCRAGYVAPATPLKAQYEVIVQNPKVLAFFSNPRHSLMGTWSMRGTTAFSGSEGSMLCVAHGLALKQRQYKVYVVNPTWGRKVLENGVAYVNLDDLPPVHTAIFLNDVWYNITGDGYSVTNIIKVKSVYRLIFWRHNKWPHFDNIAKGVKLNVSVGPQLVLNSRFMYYSVHGVEGWPDDSHRIVVIPNPVVVRARNKSAVVDTNKLVYTSDPKKGLKAAYAAFAAIHAVFPSMRLKLFCPSYANGVNVRDYRRFPLPESARTHVDVVGAVGKKVLFDEVETALAVLYPSLYRETFGNSMAEANALGTPVIHIEVGALPEVLYNGASQAVRSSHNVTDTLALVREYRNGPRPPLHLQARFNPKSVISQWIDFLQSGSQW